MHGIEREEDAEMPDAQLFHVGMAGHFDVIDERTPKRGTILTKYAHRCYDTLLLILGQPLEPTIILSCRFDPPRHVASITDA